VLESTQRISYRYSKHAFPIKKKCGHGRVCCAGDNESACLIRRSGDEVYLMGSFEWYARKDEWRGVEEIGGCGKRETRGGSILSYFHGKEWRQGRLERWRQ
jgi:hypothetical protein